jgi:hypothetical protein
VAVVAAAGTLVHCGQDRPTRRCEQTVPTVWLEELPADPDIGVREPPLLTSPFFA